MPTSAPQVSALRLHLRGVIQGVGFRPFVYGLARKLHLHGWVRNTSAGVDIQVEGAEHSLQAFVAGLREQAPPLAHIDELDWEVIPPEGYTDFEIIRSHAVEGAFQPVSPDIGLCDDCRRELFDPRDRRYRYPFINCTNCGPRFTIISDIPYDRPNTSMASFAMCPACTVEYQDPLNRRFHAQPIACSDCGPQVWLEAEGGRLAEHDEAIQTARRWLREGKIIAVKGLGGFHLACSAIHPAAVAELRRRKLRVDKPFALMMPDMETVAQHCHLGQAERELLESRDRPIVVLGRAASQAIAAEVAPCQSTLGVMLPYTPLHELLLEAEEGFPPALVMTSGNLQEEPIATDNEEARRRLTGLADAFLMHDRGIHMRCDDSVVRVYAGQVYPLRRARGYAPFPVQLRQELPPLLAVGPELKNTFCLTRDRYAFVSHHIGDMENYETLSSFQQAVSHYERLFRIHPQALAHDLHPDYMTTRYSLERGESDGLPLVAVQHHHAHIAACMADNGLSGDEPVLGVAFDGTGFGADGTIWGGEFLLADYRNYVRPFHLGCVPMPGGEAAVRQPWRLALAWLRQAGLHWDDRLPGVRAACEPSQRIIGRQLEVGLNAPLTSSMGRLFDAVSALSGVRTEINYEGQAAIELEALADLEETGSYPFDIGDGQVDAASLIQAVVEDLRQGCGAGIISARFHNAVAEMVVRVCRTMRQRYGVNQVALSGGVWQNLLLLDRTVKRLRRARFEVLLHRQVPANDGGVALGQALVAGHQLSRSATTP